MKLGSDIEEISNTLYLQYVPACPTSRAAMADGKDNDCDGIVDDDICVKTYGVYFSGTLTLFMLSKESGQNVFIT